MYGIQGSGSDETPIGLDMALELAFKVGGWGMMQARALLAWSGACYSENYWPPHSPSGLSTLSHSYAPFTQAWLQQYKLDLDALLSDYSTMFDVKAVPTPADFMNYLKLVRLHPLHS